MSNSFLGHDFELYCSVQFLVELWFAFTPKANLTRPPNLRHHHRPPPTHHPELSSDVRLFRFALPTPEHTLGLPTGKHMFLYAKVDGEMVMRAYTPTSNNNQKGYFDLVIKVHGWDCFTICFRNLIVKFENQHFSVSIAHINFIPLTVTVALYVTPAPLALSPRSQQPQLPFFYHPYPHPHPRPRPRPHHEHVGPFITW